MFYKGKEIKTISDVMDAIEACKTPEDAEDFMTFYRESVGKRVADENIGYLSGYYTKEEMLRIHDWFGVTHPYFGHDMPSAKEAFEIGMRQANRIDRL